MDDVATALSEADLSKVTFAFALLLGRSASPAKAVHEMALMSPLALLRRITSSREFHDKVVVRLSAREALPHEQRYSSPPLSLVDWIVDIAQPSEQTADLMRRARKWHDMLVLLLLDPVAGQAITSPLHHSAITRALNARHAGAPGETPPMEPAAAQPSPMVPAIPPATPTALPKAPTPAASAAAVEAAQPLQGSAVKPMVLPARPQEALAEEPISVEQAIEALESLLPGLAVPRLVALWTRLEDNVLLKTAKQLFKDKTWSELNLLHQALDVTRPKKFDLSALIARSYIYTQDYTTAAKLLSSLATSRDDHADIQFYASVALARDNDLARSVEFGRRALELRPQSDQFLSDQSSTLRRLALLKTTEAGRRVELLEESIAAGQAAMLANPKRAESMHLLISRNLFELRRYGEVIEETDRLLELKADAVDALMLRSQTFLALNQVRDALAVAEQILKIDPAHQGALYQLRSLKTLVDDDDDEGSQGGSVAFLAVDGPEGGEGGFSVGLTAGALWRTVVPPLAAAVAPIRLLGALETEWVAFLPSGTARPATSAAWITRLRESSFRWCGRILLADEAGAPLELWRRDLLQGFAESGLLPSVPGMPEEVRRYADVTSTLDLLKPRPWSAADSAERVRAPKHGTVIAMSRHGVIKFGGGEQFLDSMAEHYQNMGFDPIVVGTRPEMVGQSGVEGGRAFHFVSEDPAALRRFFLETRPVLVHVLSGLGYQVAAALDYLDIPFVYGVHFWRDCLGRVEGDPQFFLDFDRNPVPRPAFRYVLQRAATVYSNSEYTKAVLEECFYARTPIIYSLPRDVDPAEEAQREAEATELLGDRRGFVLLANAKGEKGFDLLVATAQLCPDVPFVAISSQSERNEAEATIEAAGVENVTILPRTDRIDLLYHRSKVVAVPSYRFVETFSRVCIEAQRFGKPVLGSDKGNVPYLLRDSGVVLPEDPQAWATELRRIYEEPAHHADLVARAGENSSRYSYDRQRRALHGIVSSLGDQMLVGIGSGIGNMLHAAPLVRNIARRLGRKIDVVVAEDHQNSLFLLQNSDYVNTAFSLRQTVLRKKYDQLFVTHCFGSARVPFQARRTVYSRDWMPFDPGGPLHETVFNLEAAKTLLGIDYEDADVTEYFIADYAYHRPTAGRRIGIHGGSKSGFWMSKRWPGYTQLSQDLQRQGFEVASFGIEEEYVEGTLDLTGGTIAEMIDKMMTCSYFVSNDSGVMNIANALGIPLTALFGPTNPATRGPLRPGSSWLGLTKDCSPCEVTESGKRTFLSGECRCIAELGYDRVQTHIQAELARHGLTPPG